MKNRVVRWLPGPLLAAATLAASFVAAAPEPSAHCFVRRPYWHPYRRAIIVVGARLPAQRVYYVRGAAWGSIDFHVDPEESEVLVDGRLRGIADDFDGHPQKLHLRAGLHRVTLRTPDGQTATRDVEIVPGTEVELKLDLQE